MSILLLSTHPNLLLLPAFPFIFVGTVSSTSSTRLETSDILEFFLSHIQLVFQFLEFCLIASWLPLQPSAAFQLLPVLALQTPTGLSPIIVSSAVSLELIFRTSLSRLHPSPKAL